MNPVTDISNPVADLVADHNLTKPASILGGSGVADESGMYIKVGSGRRGNVTFLHGSIATHFRNHRNGINHVEHDPTSLSFR